MAKPSKLDRAAGEPRRRLLATDADAPDRPMRRAGRKHEFARMKRALRKAERRAGDGAEIGGTGATILKFRGAPLARLVDKKRIGTEELQAADDIAIAFHAQADALIVDPPMIAVGDAIQGGTNLYAGAINWVDPDYDERTGEVLRPITLNGEGLQWGTEYVDKVERVLNEAFFLNVLNLPEFDGKQMTATEIQMRMKEYIRRATPLFEPMDLEYNGKLCQATFDLMERIGAFGSLWERPAKLRGERIAFKFQNPLVQAEAEAKTVAFGKLVQLSSTAMQLDPTISADVDTQAAFRDAVEGTGASQDWVRPKDDADRIRAQQRAQADAAQHAAALGHVGEQAGKVAMAAKNAGEAGTALQQAGLA